jgi:hypothetical protein
MYCVEECVDWFVVVNGEGEDFIAFVIEGGGVYVAKVFKEMVHDGDNVADDEAGIVIGDGFKEIRVYGFFDLLDDGGSFEEIAFFECLGR